VSSIIHSIDSKLKSDTPLDNKEKSFLAMTSLPVMKFLMVLNSTQYGNAAVDMDEYSVLIAEDLMQRYLSQLLEGVSQATMGSALNEDLLKDIQKRVDTASKKIAAINPRISGKLEQKLELIQNIARIEKQLAAGLSGSLS
jgi:conjugative transfer pilus assembly protein TraH